MIFINKLQRRFQNFKWDRSEKYLLNGLGVFILFIAIGFGFDYARRNFLDYKITLAAGKRTGESYILSEALARIAQKNTNIRIDVCRTDGTEDNISSLEDKPLIKEAKCLSGKSTQKLKAHLGTTQADIFPGMNGRIVANLYQDHFQLVINPRKIQLPQNIQDFNFDALKGKTIGTPEGGGQRKSFENIAGYFNINFNFLDSNPENADAVFRVRNLGNEEILQLIKLGWKLVPIKQVIAMKQTKYPAYFPSKIPQGVYQGSPAAPEVNLETIAVQRTLLAREDVPDWVIEKVTKVLNENRQEIKEAIGAIAKERRGSNEAFNEETIYPLLNLFEEPNNSDVQIHQGALNYYDRQKPSFIQEYADYLALLLTLVLLISSWLLRIKVWRDRLNEREANEKVDRYIEQVVDSMTLNPQSQGSIPTVVKLTKSLKELFQQQEKLRQVFKEASHSLDKEEISQSGFRVFSEAYKSAGEVVERAIEDRQRLIVSNYANQLKELLKRLDTAEKPDSVLKDLDRIRNDATETLLQEDIFSRQSFRTFVETYNFIRDAIERSYKV